MTTYYYELVYGHGRIEAIDDQSAIERLSKHKGLLCIYKEGDAVDGIPFVVVWEKNP